MKYIKTYENFTPIKINSHKPYKVNKNIDKSLHVLQNGLKALKKRLPNERNMKNRSEIIKTINQKNQKFRELSFQKLKQAEYLKNNPIDENVVTDIDNKKFWCFPTAFLTPDKDGYFRFQDAAMFLGSGKITLKEDDPLRLEQYADYINKYSLKYIFIGLEIKISTKNIFWYWDLTPDSMKEKGLVFQGYVDMTEDEIEFVETDLAAQKYNL